MTLTIDLPPQTEAWLQTESQRRGVRPADVVEAMLTEHVTLLPPGELPAQAEVRKPLDAKAIAAIEYLRERARRDYTDDPEEIRKSEAERDELHRALNANRAATGERLVFPE